MKLKKSEHGHIRNIIFDLGNVLVDIDMSLTVNAFRQLGLGKFDESDIHPHNRGIFLDLEVGKISNKEFFDSLRSYATGRLPHDYELMYAWNFLILPFEFERFELVDKLAQNYRIFLLSNTNLPHRQYFEQKFAAENPAGRPFESYFEKCFYSDAMRLRKPDTQIYAEVLSQAQIDPRETLFIDDNAHNFVGATELGIHCHHLVKPETIYNLFQ